MVKKVVIIGGNTLLSLTFVEQKLNQNLVQLIVLLVIFMFVVILLSFTNFISVVRRKLSDSKGPLNYRWISKQLCAFQFALDCHSIRPKVYLYQFGIIHRNLEFLIF